MVQENAMDIQSTPLRYNYETKFIFALTPLIETSFSNTFNTFITNNSSSYPNKDEMYWLNYAQLDSYQKIQLTSEQKKWVAEKKTIIVAVPKYSYPLGYRDDNGNFSGLSAQLLNIVSESTGLKFTPVFVDSLEEMIEYVRLGKADMGAHRTVTSDYTPNTVFSPPFYISRFVAIVRYNDNEINSSKDINGKRIVFAKGQKIIQESAMEYPQSIIDTIDGSEVDLLSAVANNTADVTIMPKIVSSYWVKSYYDKKLKEIPLTNPPAVIAFTINRKHPILNEILKKVMLSAPYNNLSNLDYHLSKSTTPPSNITPKITDIIYFSLSILALISITIILFYIRARLVGQRKKDLVADNNRLKKIIDSMPYPIYSVKKDGSIGFANKAFYSSLSIKNPDNIRTLKDIESLERDSLSTFIKLHETAHSENKAINIEQKYNFLGEDTYIKQWLLPVEGKNEQDIDLLCGWFNVTYSKKLEINLENEKKNTEDATKAKSIFLAQISHEIRTPLSIIIGIIELLWKKAHTIPRPLLERQALLAYRNSRTLLGLLDQVINYTKTMASERSSVNNKLVDIYILVEDIVSLYRISALEKGLKLHYKYNNNVPRWIISDELKLQQLLNNLLSNAIKFTEKGSVTVSLDIKHLNKKQAELKLTIKDTGIGIESKFNSKLFDFFEQTKTSIQEHYDGSGLGLAICKQISLLLNGTISLKSEQLKGTEVNITIPVIIATQQANNDTVHKLTTEDNYSMLHIAIIDDSSASSLLLKAQLEQYRVNVSETNDLVEVRKRLSEGLFDAVISDLNMKNMTGYDVLKIIADSTKYPPPCYIYTDNVEKEIEEKCLMLGATGLIIKPSEIDHMQEILSHVKSSQQLYRLLITLEKNAYGKQDMLLKMVNVLSDTVSENIQQLQKLVLDDKKSALKIAHSIKGILSLLRLEELMKECDNFAAILEHNPEEFSPALQTFEQSLLQFLSNIRQCQMLINKQQSMPET
ncbi:ATP-binding protein [Yersinia pekkanenii]|uniref:histidine kinase n=1 Tax=Yersinia pekkanenii TaxID=1288385 RepID=A0A0T9NM83_9GAMM|nr:ATP-binding protein [Yersinia pekkanenii]CNH19418.1 putative virulence sensor protein [Yersinia pekkanenii]CRY66067.1 putative virulence sensor protein [Yersinia pekkanenii]